MALLKSKPYIKSYDREADREWRAFRETVTSRRADAIAMRMLPRAASAPRDRDDLSFTVLLPSDDGSAAFQSLG